MPVQQRKVKGTPSHINVIYQAKQDGPAADTAAAETPWRRPAIILMPLCLLLLILVIVMAQRVYHLTKKSEEQLEILEIENIVLSETLQQLTTGKEDNCSMCEVGWDQWGNRCYFFATSVKTWHRGLKACTSMSASLVKIETKKELEFLQRETSKHFYPRQRDRYYSPFWTGLTYDNNIGNWTWADGSRFSFQLFQVSGAKGCVYIQKEKFYPQSCAKRDLYICEKLAKFGGP
ncbi:natural killer cells antigen CD94-like [Pelodiscus sinensis]|uniref:natural killer cells antigen CD94-like n=1 Tax=Pelodiscus sinensis TaxID=13735 RepID=UPI003F6C1651